MNTSAKMKPMAIGLCLACCALSAAFLIFGGASVVAFAVAFADPSIALVTTGWVLIGAATFLIWNRNRTAPCCEAPAPGAK